MGSRRCALLEPASYEVGFLTPILPVHIQCHDVLGIHLYALRLRYLGWHGFCNSNTARFRRSFYAPPNSIEFVMLFLVTHLLLQDNFSADLLTTCTVSSSVLALEVLMNTCTAFPNSPKSVSLWKRLIIAICASYPPLLQDLARLGSKLARFHLSHLCLQFDWMDGQREHVQATRWALFLKNCLFLVVMASIVYPQMLGPHTFVFIVLLVMLFLLLWNQSQYYSEEKVASEVIANTPALPIDFPADGPHPFVILTFQVIIVNFMTLSCLLE